MLCPSRVSTSCVLHLTERHGSSWCTDLSDPLQTLFFFFHNTSRIGLEFVVLCSTRPLESSWLMASDTLPTAAALRATLAARCGDAVPPGAWLAVASAASVTGADAYLCHLSRSIAAAQ